MEVVPATGPFLDFILNSSYSQWGEGLSRKAYGDYNAAQLATRWGRENLQRVALVSNGRVLSSAKRYSLTLSIDGRPVRGLGLGAVFTPAESRGHGFARALIDRLLEDAAHDGFDVALLFSEIGAGYYERCGFSVVPRHTLRLSLADAKGAPGIVVRSGEARDLPQVAAMDAELASEYRLSVRRSVEWIEYGLSKKRLLAGLGAPGIRNVLFFVAEEGGRAVAYVVLIGSGVGWTIEECGDRDPTGARVGALLQVLRAREPRSAPPPLAAWLPHGWLPPQLSIVGRAPAEQVMMMRPLTASGRIVPALTAGDVHYWHGDSF